MTCHLESLLLMSVSFFVCVCYIQFESAVSQGNFTFIYIPYIYTGREKGGGNKRWEEEETESEGGRRAARQA